jgi:prophage regulatory protein
MINSGIEVLQLHGSSSARFNVRKKETVMVKQSDFTASTSTSSVIRIERLPDVIARTGMGRSWIYAAVQRGEFPKPLKLSARAVGWRSADVDAWLTSRAA